MKLFKKLTALTIALATTVMCTACGGNEVSFEDDESQEYTIAWYYVVNKKGNVEPIEAELNKYLKDKINAKIDLVPLEWGEYSNKTQNALAGGEKIDLVWVSGATYTKYAYDDTIIDIDELMSEYAPKTREMLGEEFIDGARVNGKIYGVQANKDKAGYSQLVYRKDLTDKYGIEVPEEVSSWEELYPVFDAIKEKEPNMYPFAIGSGRSPWAIRQDVENLGGTLVGFVDNSDTVVNLWETDEFKESAAIAKEMYDRGYMNKDCATNEKVSDFISQGKAFSRLEAGHTSKINELNSNEKKFVWGGVKMNNILTRTSNAIGSMQAIPFSCQNPVRVMKFIELYNTDAYIRNLINFGIEGVNYDKVSDKIIKMREGSGYGDASMQWVFGNTFGNYILESEDPEKDEKMMAFNEQTTYSKYLGFVPDLSDYNTETTACTNALGKYRQVMEFGVSSTDEYLDQLNKELKASGIDTLIEEVQRQYDEWKKLK